MEKDSRIFIAGHSGMVGSSLVRKLTEKGYRHLILKTRAQLNLLNQEEVRCFFKQNAIDYVFFAAAKVGGIQANHTANADFLYENLTMSLNVLHASAHVKKFLFLGSSCVYPRDAAQPIVESSLLTAALEATNEGYAIAKIAGLKLCEFYQRQYQRRFISAMPTNLYGIQDRFHPEQSHVIPALLQRFHAAKKNNDSMAVIWGTGTPKREFLYVDDLAEALFILMDRYEESSPINIGSGEEYTIEELARAIQKTVGFRGKIVFDPSKPDGTPRKRLDLSRIHALGWKSHIRLEEGLEKTYRWYLGYLENGQTEHV